MKRLLLLCAFQLSAVLHAQTVPYGLSVDSNPVRAEQPVQVAVNFGAASRWCGLRVDLGDGDLRDIVVEDFPMTLTKQYATAGRYVLRAQGRFVARGIGSAFACNGAPRALTLVVVERGGEQRKRDDERVREQQKRDDERVREQQKREAELARERAKRGLERDRDRERKDDRDTPKRDQGVANVPVPAPETTPPRAPAPSASRPRDGSLKVF